MSDFILRLGAACVSLADQFVPDSVRARGIEEIRRARLIVGTCLSSAVLLIIGSVNAHVDGAASIAHWPLLAMAFLLGVPLMLKATGLTSLAANLVVAAVAITISFGNFARFAGGYPPLIATAIIPLVAVLLGGWRVGLVWGGASVGQIVILAAAHAGDIQIPEVLVPTEAVIQGTSRMRSSGVLVVILGVALLYDALKSRSAKELAAARDRAERADQTKTEFVASLSHEVRTPISVIIGISDMLLDGDLDEEQRELVRTLRKSGGNLLTLVNDVLDISKIEAGRLEIESVPFDVATVARDVFRELRHGAGQKGIALDIKLQEDLPYRVLGDPGRVRQVLMNLASNAIKFTSQGGVEIEIKVERVKGGEVTLGFSVSDTGVGIPADELPRLFERYTQIDASTARVSGGTGLGLPISQELVSRMGGKLSARSQPGLGSRFWFSLPMTVVETKRPASLSGGSERRSDTPRASDGHERSKATAAAS